MSTAQTIPNTRLSGTQTFSLSNSQPSETNALVTIDRTVKGGLNSLTSADTLTIEIDRSLDGGVTFQPAAAITAVGGVIVTKGVTLSQEQVAVGIDGVTDFQVTTIATSPVRISGTVVYS